MQPDSLKANKELVSEFIRVFYNEKDFDRARSMLTDDFANHHPGAGAGPVRTIDSFREHAATPFPDFSLTVHRMIAEEDQVWTHGVVRVAPDAPGVIVVDLWRIEDGRLAEHWDVGQAVPEGSTLDEMIADAR